MKDIENFAFALACQNLSSRLLSIEPPVLTISTMQPAFFRTLDFEKLELKLTDLQNTTARKLRSTTPYHPDSAITNRVKAALRDSYFTAIESNDFTTVNWLVASKKIHGKTQSIGYVRAAKLGHLQIIKAHLHTRTIGVSQEALTVAAAFNQAPVFSYLFSKLENDLPLSIIETLLNIAIDKNLLEIFLKISSTILISRMTNQIVKNIFTRAIKANCLEIVIHLHTYYFHHLSVSDKNILRQLATTERNNVILRLLGPIEPTVSRSLVVTNRALTFSYQPLITRPSSSNPPSLIQNSTRPTP